ncbi:MAG TPA: hypothetical protein VHA56_21790 [Mucilaginibacter sp.]|nr:hypothetical protein [Mucilaginibacter sp.]
MDDQLDNDIKNRIKEVFDRYEDTTADEGWLLLREKYPQKAKQRVAPLLWWSAAAVLLLTLGAILWKANTPKKADNTLVKSIQRQPQRKNESAKKITPEAANQTAVVQAPAKAAAKTPGLSNNDQANRTAKYRASTLASNTHIAPVDHSGVKNPKKDSGTDSVQAEKMIAFQADKPEVGKDEPVTDKTQTAPVNNGNTPVIAQQKKPEKSITDMFKEDKGQQPPKDVEDHTDKKIRFGVYAGTYFNYAKGSDNEVNVGGGVTSDIRLSKKIKLVTGITIAQNSLSYQEIPTVTASAKSNLVAPAAYGVNAMASVASAPTIRNYNASLIGLEVPISITYAFNPDKTDAYVSLGLSSGTFIDESYTYKYNYPSLLSSSLKETRDQTTGSNFNGFYFAKTLNVAFGIGYPFGRNRLVIEPFLKYPLDGLGTQNLKFGAGGLNLKFNFLSSKK